ncbi:energy transducer TonB [Acetobacter cibinongensis]|nr:energy transducer TonB [Acetobacter cibinongensis]
MCAATQQGDRSSFVSGRTGLYASLTESTQPPACPLAGVTRTMGFAGTAGMPPQTAWTDPHPLPAASLSPPRGRGGYKGRVALGLALGAHALLALCLLGHHMHPAQLAAPGERAVQMVFETRASAPAQPAPQQPPAPPLTPPVKLADMPPMNMEDTPPPAHPPAVPDATDALPDMSAFPLHVPVAAPASQSRKTAKPAMMHAKAPQTSVASPAHAAAPVQSAPLPHQQAPASSPAPASVAQAAKGGGVPKLHCTPPQTHYPPMARHLHEEGEAVVEVTLAGTGAVQSARLTQSTGYDDLDKQALLAARTLTCAPPENGVLVGRIPVGFHIQ